MTDELTQDERDRLKARYWQKRPRRLGLVAKGGGLKGPGVRETLMRMRDLQAKMRAIEKELADLKRLRRRFEQQVAWIEQSFPKLRELRLRDEGEAAP